MAYDGKYLPEKPDVNEYENEDVHEVQAASVALAAAVATQKPNPWSRNMMQLYGIMAIGYLVSTMNGYDGSLMVRLAKTLGMPAASQVLH